LTWPQGWKRKQHWERAKSNFSRAGQQLSVYEGTLRVLDELRRFGVMERDIIISTNVRTRRDGLPMSNQAEPSDPGVAVYWKKNGKDQVMASDRYTRVADNLAAIAATLDAMRAIERHGGAQILERAFLGFTALPAPENWRDVLNVSPSETGLKALLVARNNYHALAKQHHPDAGGTAEGFARINRAWTDAQKELHE
jgi:hypothetical protein